MNLLITNLYMRHSMKNVCVMLVGDADNAFTLNEIPYLARAFEKVLVFAQNVCGAVKMDGQFANRIEVHSIGVAQGFSRIPRYVWGGLCTRNGLLPIRSLNVKRILSCLYARGRSKAMYQAVISVLDGEKQNLQNGVVYSFLFADQAIAAWRVAEELNRRGGYFKAFSRAHGYDLYWERNPSGYMPYQDVSIKHLEGVYPCSSYGVEYLGIKYPALRDKVHLARLGTRDYGLAPPPETRVVFATCCRMIGLKRISLFADAFCRLREKHENIHWYCIGDGPTLDEVKSIVKRHDAGSSVTFKGKMSNADLMEFYRCTPISYFVNVSTTEGVPVSIMEALSFGIPTIATNVGGTKELVSDDCGRLIEAELDSERLVEFLESELAISHEMYLAKRKRAREVWEERSSADRNYTEWVKILTAS